MDLLFFLLAAALIAALVRWWRPRLGLAEAVGFTLLTAAFFAVPLATPALQVPTDLAYVVRPWSETLEAPVIPQNPLLSDIPQQMLPFRTLVRQRLLHLEAPLWAHAVGTGQPLLGNAQSAPFAAIHWLALPLPPVRALTLAVAWQVLLALLLADVLILALVGSGGGRDGADGDRPLPATRLGAAFGAVAFAFSTYLVAWAYHPLGMAAAWLPGIFLGLLLLRRGERGGLAGLVVCGVGMATSGHPETLAHTAVACAPVALALLASRHGIPRARFAGRLAGAAVLSFLLAAPALLPVLEALPQSERAAVLAANPESVHPPPFEGRMLWTLTDPLYFGSPRDRTWNGPFNFNELASGYAGLAALALAVAAAAAFGGWRAAVLAGGAAFLLAAFKVEPFFALVEAVPEVGDAAHGRLKLFWVLAVAVAAGSGLPALARERRGRWAAGLTLAAAGALLLFAPPPGSPGPPSGAIWQRAWLWGALAGIAACLAALAVPRWRRAFPAVALGALVLDLFLLGVPFHPVVPASMDLAPPAAVAWLMERSAEAPEPFRVIGERSDLMPNTAALYGLQDPRGNDPMRPAAPAILVGRRMLHKYRIGRRVQIVPGNYPAALLDYLGVRYVLTRHHARLPAPLERVWNGPGGRIWENPRALPPFFLPDRVEPSPDADDALDRAVAISDFRRLAIVEGGAEAGGQSGTARVVELTPNGFELEVRTPTGGFVASSVSHAPGWRLEVGGRPVPVQRVNGGFVGFRVDPGSHRARLEYRPASWTWGVRLGLLGLALSAAVAWRATRRGRLRRPA